MRMGMKKGRKLEKSGLYVGKGVGKEWGGNWVSMMGKSMGRIMLKRRELRRVLNVMIECFVWLIALGVCGPGIKGYLCRKGEEMYIRGGKE